MRTTNYHVLKVRYYGATNTSGSRVGIISDRFEQRITIPYNYNFNNSLDIALDHLNKLGYNIIGVGELKDEYAIITDTFKPLKDK